MAIDFPDSPSVGQTTVLGDKTWTWNGTVWNLVTSSGSDHGTLGGLEDDDHTQYALADGTRGTFEASGAVSTHEAASDPHNQYLLADGSRTATELTVTNTLTVDTNTLHVDSTNNRVGIGTTTPNSALSVTGVNSETRPLLDLQASLAPGESGSYQRGIRLLNSGMTAGQELLVAVGRSDNTRNQGQMYFQYSGDGSTSNRLSFGLFAVDDVLNIMGSGNVGIGDTTPSYKLDVNGDINATGDLRIGGTAVGGWTAFTPTWTAATTNPSIGNGTLRGRYTKVNDLVIAQYDLRMGSTTTFGAGIWYMSFPVAADFTNMFSYMDLGAGRVYDSSAQTVYNLHIIGFNGNSTSFRLIVDGPQPHNLDANIPFAWSANDEVLFTIWYKAA